MVTRHPSNKKILIRLLKDFSSMHTITSLSKELVLTRVGIWKALKKLEHEKYIILKAIGKGKTATYLISLNWENPLVEKTLSLYLAEEAVKQKRWQVNFTDLENFVGFIILYGSIINHPQEANDIDILCVATKNNFVKIQAVTDNIQKTQNKKIHAINFTENELKVELKKPNKVFIEAIQKGVILFKQENFIQFMKNMTK